MKDIPSTFGFCAGLLLLGGLSVPLSSAHAEEPPASEDVAASIPFEKGEKHVPTYDLLDAAKKGLVTVSAQGLGDGRMSLSVHNKSKSQLRVVLPPGLIVSGASGQFGGMGGGGMGGGGMGGGGMGGGGMGGGGMGGGGMGGGGMGGMGGGGMGGGGMGGGGMGGGGGTMPATMGMMMLARLIMQLVGERSSWNQASLMGGMGGGMGGMGGGGMGGMGGGGMGGMGGGGGFRSVPPTSLPFTTLKPNQTQDLPTRLASLTAPDPNDPASGVALPEKGEPLRISDIRDQTKDLRVLEALTRLAKDKAPESIATMVMWNVASGLDWNVIAEKSQGWANAYELTLARSFVAQLGNLPKDDTGLLLYEIKGTGTFASTLAQELSAVLKDRSVLGLKVASGVPRSPESPAVACKIVVGGTSSVPEATVFVATTDSVAKAWVPAGKFTLPIALKAGKPEVARFADALAEGLLGRLVRTQLSKVGVVKGKMLYKVRIDNASPLILNGPAILGTGEGKADSIPKVLSGVSISPRESVTVPATSEVVEMLGLKKGVRVIAADLSGL
ncbi:MAG: hypothetical protein NVSMB9_12640 [Isosphaeraceae bacterium]